jgi:hypothetical protein
MIKNFNLFKESVDEKSKIRKICKEYKIKNYTINNDLSIDVDDSVGFFSEGLVKMPLKFNRVSGNFNCSSNYLTSLLGCPQWVGSDFACSGNKIDSLEFFPKFIGGGIYVYNNKLTSLKGIPKNINYIDCDNNKIWSFIGIPDNFRGGLLCEFNPIENIWKLFESIKDIEFLNDCHALREPETPDGLPIVVIERLNFFLETIGKPTVEKVDGYINI